MYTLLEQNIRIGTKKEKLLPVVEGESVGVTVICLGRRVVRLLDGFSDSRTLISVRHVNRSGSGHRGESESAAGQWTISGQRRRGVTTGRATASDLRASAVRDATMTMSHCCRFSEANCNLLCV